MEKTFEEYNIIELKALGYDEAGRLERATSNLRAIYARIEEVSQQQKSNPLVEKKSKELPTDK